MPTTDPEDEWLLVVPPGKIPIGWLMAAVRPEHVIDVVESEVLTGYVLVNQTMTRDAFNIDDLPFPTATKSLLAEHLEAERLRALRVNVRHSSWGDLPYGLPAWRPITDIHLPGDQT